MSARILSAPGNDRIWPIGACREGQRATHSCPSRQATNGQERPVGKTYLVLYYEQQQPAQKAMDTLLVTSYPSCRPMSRFTAPGNLPKVNGGTVQGKNLS